MPTAECARRLDGTPRAQRRAQGRLTMQLLRALCLISVLAAPSFGVIGCQREKTTSEKIEDAAEDAADEIGDAAEKAEDAVKDATN
jgi:hypothetical protein